MAIDEAVLTARIQGKVPNTLRFFMWNPSAVSIGRFQNASNEVDLKNCKNHGVDVVRRISGGGAVYHDCDGEITYSVIVSSEDVGPGDVFQAYRKICGGLTETVEMLGVQAGFSPGDPRQCPNITVGGKKLSGSAQAHKRGILLQHGTLLMDVNLTKMFTYLKVPWAKTNADVIGVAERKLTSLERERGSSVSTREACRALATGFEKALDMHLEAGELTRFERDLAQRLCTTKFATDNWNLRGKTAL
jgi:lipoate-protein ligase A